MFTSISAAVLLTNFFTSFLKNLVQKYGDQGVHLMVLALAVIASAVIALLSQYPTLMDLIKTMGLHAVEIFSGAVALYEAVWKQIGKVTNLTVAQSN